VVPAKVSNSRVVRVNTVAASSLAGWWDGMLIFGANTIGGASDSYIRDIEENDSVLSNRGRGYFRVFSVMARTAGWSTRRSAVIA
jgi:hypothetical protein